MIRASSIVLLLCCCVGALRAESVNRPITVGPHNNGVVGLDPNASPGDDIAVSFSAAANYAMKTADVKDSEGLGWVRTGPFSFSLNVPPSTSASKTHDTGFNGTLIPLGEGTTPPPEIPWDVVGQYELLGDHEGQGADLGRAPPAALTTDKPYKGPSTVGQATYDAKAHDFVGTFVEDGQNFTGQYVGSPIVDSATMDPVQLGDPKPGLCPDGDGAQVTFVYFGVGSAKNGGKADPDEIQLNGFTQNPSAAALRKLADAADAASEKANAAVIAAVAAAKAAADAAAKAKQDIETALNNVPAVKRAQQKVANDTAALATAKTRQAAAEKALADVQAKFDKGLLGSGPLKRAKQDVAAAQALVATVQGRLDADNDALTKAKDNAGNDPGVKLARQKSAEADAAATAAAKAASDAQKAAADAAQAETIADGKADAAEQIDKDWASVLASLLIHEQGHQKICYAHADEITDMLNHLRAWGYAPDTGRASALGQSKYKSEWRTRVTAIQAASRAAQTAYDALTNHGQNQGKWNGNTNLK